MCALFVHYDRAPQFPPFVALTPMLPPVPICVYIGTGIRGHHVNADNARFRDQRIAQPRLGISTARLFLHRAGNLPFDSAIQITRIPRCNDDSVVTSDRLDAGRRGMGIGDWNYRTYMEINHGY